jgi:hypothetical protein
MVTFFLSLRPKPKRSREAGKQKPELGATLLLQSESLRIAPARPEHVPLSEAIWPWPS